MDANLHDEMKVLRETSPITLYGGGSSVFSANINDQLEVKT